MTLTITFSGNRASGKTLACGAVQNLLEQRGFAVHSEDRGDGYDVLSLVLGGDDFAHLAAYGRENEKAPSLDWTITDVHNRKPDQTLLGTWLRHTGNGKVYIITGFAWMGETDEWGFLHHAAADTRKVTICRPLWHLTGERSNGEKRYVHLGRSKWALPADYDGKLVDNLTQLRAVRENTETHPIWSKDLETVLSAIPPWHDGGPLVVEDELDRARRTFDGKTPEQRLGLAWKVVGTDNYNRDSVEDFVFCEGVRCEAQAKVIATALNDRCKGGDVFYVAKPHDAPLSRGMLDLV